jgi:hypothetical protein
MNDHPISSVNDAVPSEVLRYQSKRNIVFLFKSFLAIMSRVADEHDIAFDKLDEYLPVEYQKYTKLADYFTDEKREMLRKEILDAGNDCIRAVEEEIRKYVIDFK